MIPGTVYVGGRGVRVDKNLTLGTGGEATVVKLDVPGEGLCAGKFWHQATPQRVAKLEDFFGMGLRLPTTVIAPRHKIEDGRGQVLGFTMPLLPPHSVPIAQMANVDFCRRQHITNRDVVNFILNAYGTLKALHADGVVVGDLNDLNELLDMIRRVVVLWLDVDSMQVGRWPCLVATERYLDPQLYGVDLGARPAFRPGNDIYSLCVLLFRSLLKVHPFGGVHRKVRRLPQRAQQGILVYDAGVRAPKEARSFDFLTDELLEALQQVFVGGKRNFPLTTLEQFAQELVECPRCKVWYPRQRAQCPGCQVRIIVAARLLMEIKGVIRRDYLITRGQILFFKQMGPRSYCVAEEGGKAALYIKESAPEAPSRRELGPSQPGIRYEVFDDCLIVAGLHGEKSLSIFDLETGEAVAETTTEAFGGQRSVFACSTERLYRIANQLLMRGGISSAVTIRKLFVEEVATQVLNEQTWCAASSHTGGEFLLGFIRVFKDFYFWALVEGERFEVDIPPLELGERMVDIRAVFVPSREGVVLLRQTRKGGVEYAHVTVIGSDGEIIKSRTVKVDEDKQYQRLKGKVCVYSGTRQAFLLLHPTDGGLLQENAATGDAKQFSATEPFVSANDRLHLLGKGILVEKRDRVLYLEMEK